jgi:hypothetical protein
MAVQPYTYTKKTWTLIKRSNFFESRKDNKKVYFVICKLYFFPPEKKKTQQD